jgi:hypothetical protein
MVGGRVVMLPVKDAIVMDAVSVAVADAVLTVSERSSVIRDSVKDGRVMESDSVGDSCGGVLVTHRDTVGDSFPGDLDRSLLREMVLDAEACVTDNVPVSCHLSAGLV